MTTDVVYVADAHSSLSNTLHVSLQFLLDLLVMGLPPLY